MQINAGRVNSSEQDRMLLLDAFSGKIKIAVSFEFSVPNWFLLTTDD
jgi:hypothetical protein